MVFFLQIKPNTKDGEMHNAYNRLNHRGKVDEKNLIASFSAVQQLWK